MVFENYIHIWNNIESAHRVKLLRCIVIAVLASICEITTLSLIVPIFSLILNPEGFPDLFGVELSHYLNLEGSVLLLYLSAAFSFFIAASIFIRIYLVRYQSSFAMILGTEFSRRIFSYFLNIPYLDYKQRDHADMASLVYQKTHQTIRMSVLPAIIVVTNSVLLLFVVGMIFYLQPILSSILIITIVLFYFVLFRRVRSKIAYSSEVLDLNFKLLMETLSSALSDGREVRLLQNQNKYIHHYHKLDRELRTAEVTINVMSAAPRYLLEGVIILLMMGCILVLFLLGKNNTDVITSVTLIGVAGQRFSPVAQSIFSNALMIKSNTDTMRSVVEILDESSLTLSNPQLANDKPVLQISGPFRKLQLKDISFNYSNCQEPVIKCANFSVAAGEVVAIIGESGSGKTTLFDICLGLVSPSSGSVLVNDERKDLFNTVGWERTVSVVSQEVFLHNRSVKYNITGVDDRELTSQEMLRLNSVLSLTLLTQQISKFTNGIDTPVGHLGINLSGGQRQRVAIARAIYRNTAVLFLDEATSALDEVSQNKILSNIKSLVDRPAIVMITHRPSSLEICDRVYYLDKGVLTHAG